MAWSGKKVEALLKQLSQGGKAFPTTESVRKAPVVGYRHGYTTRGYFSIAGAYGGYKLEYNLPYSSGVHDVTSGFISSGKLADKLEAMGTIGLKATYREMEKHYRPIYKARYLRMRKEGKV
jgi:hypothetical protein